MILKKYSELLDTTNGINMKKEIHIFEKNNLAVEVQWNTVLKMWNCCLFKKDETYDLKNGAFIKAFVHDDLNKNFDHIIDWCKRNKRKLKNSKPFTKEKQ